MTQVYSAEVAIIGSGLAGLVTALELLDRKKRVIIVDRDLPEKCGGLAKESFGGMALCGTPWQKLNRIKDTPALMLRDWLSFADFSAQDVWPRRWAEAYAERNYADVFCWLKTQGVNFFPAVNWVERGDYLPGNSVPRYHVVWGTGWELVRVLVAKLASHPQRHLCTTLFGHHVTGLQYKAGVIIGVEGIQTTSGKAFACEAPVVVVAAGGINGNLDKVRCHWPSDWPPAPESLLNGSHQYADGTLHDDVQRVGGQVTHLEWQWNYAAGIQHPHPTFPQQGLSLIPPKSALWMDCRGRRIGPQPMVTGFDTHMLCKRVCEQERQYTWQVMNRKIMLKEVSISGSEHNPSLRDKKLIAFLKEILLGNETLYRYLTEQCPDVVVADTLDGLVEKMNALTGENLVSVDMMRRDIGLYDQQIDRGAAMQNDDQVRRIEHARRWKGDKVRTLKRQKIMDDNAGPLIAVREFLISRKSMGGIQTDLHSRVLDATGNPLAGLYAVGEAAGFGGGGINGKRSLEGTFLSNCILTGRIAGRAIAGENTP